VNALSRRDFLARATGTAAAAAATAVAAGGLGSLLSACDSANATAGLLSQPQPPGPTNPVTWPISAGNKPIADGLRAERDATLAVYTWPDRIASECVDKFSRKHGCLVKVTTFGSMREAMTTLTTKPTRFDVFLGVPIAVLGSLIGGGLVQPLNHSYVPNISQAWPQFTNPFYDQHWQYTVPYTVYTTGIGWRRDKVHADPYALVNGWQVLGQPEYEGHVAILDDYREGISLGLMYGDVANIDPSFKLDLNTTNPLFIDAAAHSLTGLANQAHPRLSNTAFSDLAAGTTWVQHAWSGQVAAASKNLPPGTHADVLGYWFPPDASGPVANDTITIPRGSRNPVLAHLFMNFMLDWPNALANARGIGYTQPLNWITPQRLVHHGALPASMIGTTVLQIDLYRGLKELQLPSAANALWQQAWQSTVTHMQLSEATKHSV
jgi:spermidine/putrescine transport system substrate-binding protein